ncbi:MAG TPA: SprB repeat-containing protein, partial [Bacteroidia bacterium]|nr:SprB repeat-containing protein [Bacteroidia bacterium]
MRKISIRLHFFVFIFLSVVYTKAQDSVFNNATTNWLAKWQIQKVFIENKGQFKLPAASGIKAEVKYAYDEGTTKIFFTPKGLVYSFKERKKKRDHEEERERAEKFKNAKEFLEKEKEEKVVSYKTDVVSMQWEGANADVQIISEDKSTEYFSYSYNERGESKNINYLYGYKKITYKNLYPNIDVEYIFNPTDGIKYSFILHPSADASLIKMTYSNRVKLNSDGEIHISTKFDNIVEHAPQTFYANNKSLAVASKFIKTGKTISLQIGDYDKTKTLIIDPWVQTPSIANSNCVWECEKDGAGNIYIIGGDVPMKLLKYNSAGVLQWTFVTAYDTSQNDWLGTFATDLAGNSYVTCGASASLTKVSPAGAQIYKVNGSSTEEYWNIAFNCDQTKLIIGGTNLNAFPTVQGYGTIFDINTSNGSVNSTKNVGFVTGGGFINNPDEVRSITSSRNAKYYYLTLDSMGCIDQNFSACPTANSLFKINHTYNFGYKCENYRPQNGNSGMMSIRANRYFVYTQNGKTVHKRSLGSGAILATATIPGGISTTSLGFNQAGNSGIDIDSCGNVYVGSGNAVIKYDANLNQLSSVTLPFAVYDVAVSYGGNVVVSGATGTSSSTSRTGYVQSINMSACNPMTLFCCDATICPAGPFCTTAPSVTLTPVTSGGTWSGAGVNASGVFNPATAGAGTHTIIYTLACGSDSIEITVNTCVTLTVCQSGGNITVSNGTAPYNWYKPTTYTNCSGCPGGNCAPFICPGVVTTSLTPIATNTATIAAPGSYPVIVKDNSGTTYTITSLASVPPCSACTPPTLSVTATNSVSCFGAHTGSATVTATPAGTYTYTWQPGNLNGASQTGLAAGVYTVSVSSSSTCTGTITVNITQPASALSASITATSPASCGQNNGSITVTPSGGTAGYTYTWTPSGGNA